MCDNVISLECYGGVKNGWIDFRENCYGRYGIGG
jgi:hypothetical protein